MSRQRYKSGVQHCVRMFNCINYTRDCGEVVECLIRLGAKIDVPGHEGNFPLHVASNSGSLVSVNIIAPLHKERGFDIDCMVGTNTL